MNRKKYGSTEGGGINDGFTPSENPSAIPIFPHSEEWRSLHGKWTSENGREACFKCHTKEGSDKPGSVPGCFSCHKGYPHLEPSEWDVFTGHGQTAKEAGVDSCKLCHGADLTTMKQGKNCFSCHPSFPHKLFSPDPSWEAAHGRYVLSRSIEECQTCHGTTNNDRRNPSCIGCHPFNYPHANDWLKTRGEIQPHGEYVKEHTSASCARAACHGTNLIPEANITKGPACNNATCHGATFPHTSTWRSEHGGYVLSNTPESCKSCHGADLRGTRNNPSCHNTACHETFPHTADWVSPRGGIQPHGEYVKTHESEFRQTCGKARCHGTYLDARGQARGPSCYNAQCHGPVFLHSETWNQDHRSYVLDNTPNGCRTCHGNNFQGGPRNNPSCYPCHPFSYPHQEGWANPRGQSQPHGDTVNRDSSATCARAECHGVNLVPSAGVTKGPDCSSTGCHTDPYPHSSNFASGTNHGPAARLNINACRACHGNNLDQAPTGYRSCINCHPSISEHNLVTGTADWQTRHPQIMRGAPYYSTHLNECKICHGSNLDGGISRKSCFTGCHDHLDGKPADWMDPTKPEHGKNFARQTGGGTTCAMTVCHGPNYDRAVGPQNRSCIRCHTNGITHKTGWRTGTGHGHYFLNTLRLTSSSSSNICWNCHRPPIAFRITDTTSTLASASDCYNSTCHLGYPHKSFILAGGTEWPWEPVFACISGQSTPTATNWGHFIYLFNSQFFFNTNGLTPSTPDSDPLWRQAIARTCGGSLGGSCHYNGNRSYNTGAPGRCGVYCHGVNRPPPPVSLRDCTDPPASSVSPNAPAVQSTTPASSATGISVGASISATFSEAMDRTSLLNNSNSFTLRKVSPSTPIPATITCSADWCQSATLTPSSPLANSTLYEAKITNTVTDWNGTAMTQDTIWQFTTIAPDTTRPTVISTDPANGATVPLYRPYPNHFYIRAVFSEPLDPSSIGMTVTESDENGNTSTINGTITCFNTRAGATCDSIQFDINRSLSNYMVYDITIPNTVRDVAGNRLQNNYTWSFPP